MDAGRPCIRVAGGGGAWGGEGLGGGGLESQERATHTRLPATFLPTPPPPNPPTALPNLPTHPPPPPHPARTLSLTGRLQHPRKRGVVLFKPIRGADCVDHPGAAVPGPRSLAELGNEGELGGEGVGALEDGVGLGWLLEQLGKASLALSMLALALSFLRGEKKLCMHVRVRVRVCARARVCVSVVCVRVVVRGMECLRGGEVGTTWVGMQGERSSVDRAPALPAPQSTQWTGCPPCLPHSRALPARTRE